VFADFLQMLSGLTERREQRVVIATTNHLDALDEAIRNRPVRFNRKYRFPDPTNEQIDHLLELHFGEAVIPTSLKSKCHDLSFTGAHISEVKRTSELLAHKRRLPMQEVFADAVQAVQDHFTPKPKSVGFGRG
jgi:SpoVK/Ycf46/Vps4 family AAA+-type ATPase